VVINKPLKKQIRAKYERLMMDRYKVSRFVPGAAIAVSREELVQIVEDAYYSVNVENSSGNPYIRKAFDICGLNPWCTDLIEFHKHLDGLSENGIYMSLLEKNFDRDIEQS
jgi:hypothetical protein